MLPEIPFTTVWIEFHSAELAHTFYAGTSYSCRLSPACDCSVDIVFEGLARPTLNLMYIPGVAKKPDMFVLDITDRLPFLKKEARPVVVHDLELAA